MDAFQGFERLHNMKIGVVPLKAEDGVLTTTMRVKCEVTMKLFAESMMLIYSEKSLNREISTKL